MPEDEDDLRTFGYMIADLLLRSLDLAPATADEATEREAVASLVLILYRIEGHLARIAQRLTPAEDDNA